MVEETMRSRGISSRFFFDNLVERGSESKFSGGWRDQKLNGEDVWVNAEVLE
jgi:hypothetical protein